MKPKTMAVVFCLILIMAFFLRSNRQSRRLPKTPLSPKLLDIIANEISGQIIFNNEVKLAGAPWIRDKQEFLKSFYESGTIYELVKRYGRNTGFARRVVPPKKSLKFWF